MSGGIPAFVMNTKTSDCPLCRGSGNCPECKGLGVLACVFCDGLRCEECEMTGTVVCVPCDGDGKCWRCGGCGELRTPHTYTA